MVPSRRLVHDYGAVRGKLITLRPPYSLEAMSLVKIEIDRGSARSGAPRPRDNQNLLYGNATATPANTTGSDQAQSASHETATAPATQPAKKPTRSLRVFLIRSLAPSVNG